MGIGQWYVRRGRISRRTWWLHYTLPLSILAVLAGLADMSFGYPGLSSAPIDTSDVFSYLGGPLSTIVFVGSLPAYVTSTVTRLHDRNHSAWWLLWALLPFAGAIVLFVQNAFLAGTGGINLYGAPPNVPVGDPVGA